MSNEQEIMDKFVAKILEIIALKETNRELLDALQAARSIVMIQNGRHDEINKAVEIFDKAIAKALGEPS